MTVELGYFCQESGRKPAVNWLDVLSEEERGTCLRLIERLELQGHQLGMPHSRPITGTPGLFELRGRVGRVRLRIFYCFLPGSAVLLDGVRKTSDGDQGQAILRARQHLRLVLTDPERYVTYIP